MIKSLIAFRMTRSITGRQHGIKFHGHQRSIDHGIFAVAGMERETFDHYICSGGIEVFILNGILCTSVHSVGIICTKSVYIKIICAPADFFIGSKTDAEGTMWEFRRQKLFCHSHDFCHTGFVIRTEQGRDVGDDECTAFQFA